MDDIVGGSAAEQSTTSLSTIAAQGPTSESRASEVPAGSSSGEDGSAPLDQASLDEGRRAPGREEMQGYLPTPPPAPSSATEHRSELDAPAAQLRHEDNDIESDTDSLSSADTAMAEAARVPQNRRTVLFHDLTATFSSTDRFFDACRARLLDAYGVSIERYWSSELSATAKCERRLNSSCPFTVRVLAEDGVWELETDSCVWEHSHGPAGNAEAAGAARESEDGSSSDGEEEDWEAESDEEELDGRGLGIVPGSISGSWGAKTKSALVRQLVNLREDIFTKQRACQHPVLVADSQRAVDEFIKQSAKAGQSLPRSSFGNYTRFCDGQGVPPLPMTPAMVALWLVDKCSTQGDGYFKTYAKLLIKIMDLAAAGWAASAGYRSLLALDPDSDAVDEFLLERKPTQPTTERSKKRRRASISTASSASSASTGASDSASSTSSFAFDNVPHGSSSSVSHSRNQLVVPGLPKAGDTFSSARDAYGAFVRAVLPVYGVGVAKSSSSSMGSMIIKCNRAKPSRAPPGTQPCSYRVEVELDERTGRWIVAEGADEARHSHGPAAQILRDPSWRPRVRGRDARAALGMSQLSGVRKLTTSGKKVKSKVITSKRAPSKIKKRKTSTSCSKKQRVSGPEHSPADRARRQDRHERAPSPQRRELELLPRGPTYQDSTTSFPAGAALPLQTGRSAPRHLPLSSTAALELEMFLLGLHPSLAPLVPHLFGAGFDAGALSALAALEPPILDLALDHVRLQHLAGAAAAPDDAPLEPVSVIQLKLLARTLREQCTAFRSS